MWKSTGAMLALCMTLLAPASAGATIRVTSDFGGSLQERTLELEALAKGDEKIIISGTCMSACTLYLGLPQTCVRRWAVFGFHGPSSRAGFALPSDEFEKWSQKMATYYPPALRQWFMAAGRYRTVGYTRMSGAEVIRLGARPCR